VARKRKLGPREPNGRLKRTRDRGTPEVQTRRDQAYGRADISYALGIMLANNVVSAGELQACERYAFLHYVVFGRVNIAAMAYDGERPAGTRKNWPEEFIVDRKREFNAARAALSPEALNLLDNLVIFELYPRWLKPVQPYSSDVHQAENLLAAIRSLAESMGYLPKGSTATTPAIRHSNQPYHRLRAADKE
jgi:hypothetical protein